jgi:hypothetical protein
MGRIKRALEIALERTESVKSDKTTIDQYGARQQGKRLANEFLEDGKKNLEEEIKKTPPDQRKSLQQGIFDVLFAQIGLPASQDDMKRIELAGRGLQAAVSDSRFASLFKQFLQLLSRYLDETAQYAEAIKRQYEPKLRQKEEELSRRIGREVRIDPFQDPEFLSLYNQHMNALKDKYQAAADQVRDEARRASSAKFG